jgi:hypothetical protein
MIMRFGTWNVRSLYRAGVSELDMYRMDLAGVQEVSWEGSGTLESGIILYFMGKVVLNINWEPGFFLYRWNLSVTVILVLYF